LQRLELLCLAAALEHQNALADHVLRLGRAAFATAVNHLGRDIQVGVGKACDTLTAFAGHQASSSQRGASGAVEASKNLFDIVRCLDLQLDAEMGGEAFDQLVFEAGFAVAVLEIGGRTVASDHAQYAFLLDPLDRARGFSAAGEHQEESGRQQPVGAALAELGLGKHRRSIRKGEPPPYMDMISELCYQAAGKTTRLPNAAPDPASVETLNERHPCKTLVRLSGARGQWFAVLRHQR